MFRGKPPIQLESRYYFHANSVYHLLLDAACPSSVISATNLTECQENLFVKYLVLVLILGLMLQPVLRWFLYYKRIEYVFTNRRALAYYRDSQEIEFEIEASAIPDMKKTPARAGLINLHAVIEEQGELQEARGETQYVKVGFEGVPANILERYT